MTERQWGRILACGCALGYERCIACRAGLHSDQEKALAIYIQQERDAERERAARSGGEQPREPGTGWTLSEETKKHLDEIDKQTVISPRTVT